MKRGYNNTGALRVKASIKKLKLLGKFKAPGLTDRLQSKKLSESMNIDHNVPLANPKQYSELVDTFGITDKDPPEGSPRHLKILPYIIKNDRREQVFSAKDTKYSPKWGPVIYDNFYLPKVTYIPNYIRYPPPRGKTPRKTYTLDGFPGQIMRKPQVSRQE